MMVRDAAQGPGPADTAAAPTATTDSPDGRPRSSSVTRVKIAATTYGEQIGNVETRSASDVGEGKIGPSAVTDFEGTQFTGRPLVIVTVGLPGRGKSYIARRLARFLSWLGLDTCIFQVHGYRREGGSYGDTTPREYFDHKNETYCQKRADLVGCALDDMISWLRSGGNVGILDGQNVEKSRRRMVRERLREVLDDERVVYLEVGEEDAGMLEMYKQMALKSSRSFKNLPQEEASEEFEARLAYYRDAFQDLDEEDETPYIRMSNGGADVEMHSIRGYVPCRVANFLVNVNLSMQPIFLSRHGQSEYNLLSRIGGDSGLTPFGESYAEELAKWLAESAPPGLEVWCSTLLRTRMTATPLSACFPVMYWRTLEEIDAGVYDGLTYEEIKETAEQEYSRRQKNKYWYRYPHGESYHDLVARLEPVIMELERSKKPLLIVSHQAVLRVIYAYLADEKPERCTNLSMPLHTVVKMTPTYGGAHNEERFPILETDPAIANVGTHGSEDVKSAQVPAIGNSTTIAPSEAVPIAAH